MDVSEKHVEKRLLKTFLTEDAVLMGLTLIKISVRYLVDLCSGVWLTTIQT